MITRFLAYFLLTIASLSASQPRVAMLYDSFGERESTSRQAIAARNLNWEVGIWQTNSDSFDPKEVEEFAPDFVIATKITVPFIKGVPNYLVMYQPYQTYVGELRKYSAEVISSYAGALVTTPQIDRMGRILKKYNLSIAPFPWYPTVQKRELSVAEPDLLFYCGANWDSTRNSTKYKKIFSLLAGQDYFRVYGKEDAWSFIPKAYGGFIPADGETFLKEMSRHGIALVLHDIPYNREGVTSGRIFESVSAGCVVICDSNRFVVKEFGDSVLYIDEGADPEEVFAQIDSHVKWIKENPEEARKLVLKAQAILEENFLMEGTLKQLEAWHHSLADHKNSLAGVQ